MADEDQGSISRRSVVAAGVGFVPLAALTAQRTKMPSPPGDATPPKLVLSPAHLATLDAFLFRLCPADDLGPGAVEMGASNFINRALGDWMSAEAPAFTDGLTAIDAYSQRTRGGAFVALAMETQDSVITEMEAGTAASFPNARNIFARIRQLMLQGMFSDPHYGGNRNFAGWDLIAYPGAVMASTPQMAVMGERLKSQHKSAYPEGTDHNGH